MCMPRLVLLPCSASLVALGFAALSSGIFPNSRHDGKGWEDVDEERKDLGVQAFKMRGVLLRIKGDWG